MGLVKADHNRQLAEAYLHKMGTNPTPEAMSEMFTTDCEWNVPGDVTAFPWIGQKKGREAAATFVREERKLLQRERFDVEEMFVSDQRAVILIQIKTRVAATHKIIECPATIVLTFKDDKIASFLLLEDSFAVSNAAKKD